MRGKKGEFEVAISEKYINKDKIISRNSFVRSYCAYKGKVGVARTVSGDKLFNKSMFHNIIPNEYTEDSILEMVLAYEIFLQVMRKEKEFKKDDYGFKQYGHGLKYGKYAIVGACSRIYYLIKKDLKSLEDIKKVAEKLVNLVLSFWKSFEENVSLKEQHQVDFDNYYKSSSVEIDIKNFFEQSEDIEEACACFD
ncbi:MAG: hypothetical protein RSC49_04040 [Clostridium sp.]